MRWHEVYQRRVLAPDYEFAVRVLGPYFFDALTAHALTLERAGVAGAREAAGGLASLREHPLPPYSPDEEDFFFYIDRALEREAGPQAAGALRLGLSRNDLDMTVYRMWARDIQLRQARRLATLREVLLRCAEQHLHTVMVAYTHHQPAQPTTLAHYLIAVVDALARDQGRFRGAWERLNRCPMGAVALAGSSHSLDREYTASLLGFAGPVVNTYDAVSAADWQVEWMGCIQACALTLSRFVHDLITWASGGALHLPDTLVQTSSVMPQKRNPVALEHARGRLSGALGRAQTVLLAAHNVPLGDVNDVGPGVLTGLEQTASQFEGALELLIAVLSGCRFDPDKLYESARHTGATATELADDLVRRTGLSFREAHRIVATLATRLNEAGRELRSATPDDVVAAGGPLFPADLLAEALDPRTFVARRSGLGGPAPEAVAKQLASARASLEQDRAAVEAYFAALASAQSRLRAITHPEGGMPGVAP